MDTSLQSDTQWIEQGTKRTSDSMKEEEVVEDLPSKKPKTDIDLLSGVGNTLDKGLNGTTQKVGSDMMPRLRQFNADILTSGPIVGTVTENIPAAQGKLCTEIDSGGALKIKLAESADAQPLVSTMASVLQIQSPPNTNRQGRKCQSTGFSHSLGDVVHALQIIQQSCEILTNDGEIFGGGHSKIAKATYREASMRLYCLSLGIDLGVANGLREIAVRSRNRLTKILPLDVDRSKTPDDILVISATDFNTEARIERDRLESLVPSISTRNPASAWLNDDTVQACLKLLVRDNDKHVHVVHHGFYNFSFRPQELLNHMKNTVHEVKQLERILVADYHEKHWTLFSLDPSTREVQLFDSLQEGDLKFDAEGRVALPPKYASQEEKLKTVIDLLSTTFEWPPVHEWNFIQVRCAQQKNTKDCGIYVLANAAAVIRGERVPESIDPIRSRFHIHESLVEAMVYEMWKANHSAARG